MASSLQMIGNTALLDLPDKVAFLSSRRISAAAVFKCYDWAAAVRNEYILDNCRSAVFASLDPCGSLARLVAARPALNYRVLDEKIARSPMDANN